MASARFAWGIDIGNRALKAIRLTRGDAGLKIDDFEVIEHENVLSNTGDNRESIIQSALANFVQRHPIKGDAVAISVSGVSSFARFVKLPPVEAKRIPEIVRFEAIQQIPFPLDDVEWSYQLFQTPDSPEVEVGIFAMRRELINTHIQHFTSVDLNVQYVQMNPLAVYNAMYYDGRLKGTTMIIDLGAENTDLIIADGETIWLRSIPIGGNNFTEVLVKSFKLPFAKAEELKRNAATSKYARQIFQAMRPVFADLVAEIQRSMGFYASVHRDSRIKKIIALGGTFRLPGLQKYLQQNLQLDVERMDRLAAGAPTDGKLATTFNENLLSLVSAYGLAIQAMGEGKITSSLLPQSIRREKMWRDKTKWFGAAAGLFVLGTAVAVGGYYIGNIAYKNADATRSKNQDLLARATAFSTKWATDVEKAGGPEVSRINNVRTLLNERNLWPSLEADIFAQLPPLPKGMVTGDANDIAAMKKTPRAQRDILLVRSMRSEYKDDLLKAIAGIQALSQPGSTTPTAATPPPGTPPGAPPVPGAIVPVAADDPLPPGSRGFIITLDLTTPLAGGYSAIVPPNGKGFKARLEALGRNWMDAYNKVNPQDKKDYYIARVSQPDKLVQILKDNGGRMKDMTDSYNASLELSGQIPGGQNGNGMAAPVFNPALQQGEPAGPGPRFMRGRGSDFGRGDSPPPPVPVPALINPQGPAAAPPVDPAEAAAAAAAAANAPFMDRITGEDRRSDWTMTVYVVVVVGAAEGGSVSV